MDVNWTDSQTRWMARALRLASRGRDAVSPNPLVGAVIVAGGRVVGEGYHRRFGGAHAEVEAIESAGAAARGAEMYVTLEPCAHQGKTPPCCDAILAAGLRRVIFAASDANPATRGRGPRRLEQQGVEVACGLLENEARRQNAPYFHWRRTGRPWVVLKWAMSLDGKIAARTGDSRWISGEAARRHAHALRRRVDAVLVGTGTLRRDDPNLLPRPARGRVPLRVIVDRRGTLPLRLQVLAADGTPRLYVTAVAPGARRRAELESRGIEVLRTRWRSSGVDLARLLDALGERGVSQVLVEGGGALHGAFVDGGLAQEIVAYVAPRLIGGAAATTAVGGRGVSAVREALRLSQVTLRRLGEDFAVTGLVSGE